MRCRNSVKFYPFIFQRTSQSLQLQSASETKTRQPTTTSAKTTYSDGGIESEVIEKVRLINDNYLTITTTMTTTAPTKSLKCEQSALDHTSKVNPALSLQYVAILYIKKCDILKSNNN
jgi:hypothetical protein